MKIHQEIIFKCNSEMLFAVLTEAKIFAKWSGMPADIAAMAGGRFSTFGGLIEGQTLEIESSTMLVQAWRVASWEKGIYSIAKFSLHAGAEGETKLVFDHTGFPEEQEPHLNKGWYVKYWDPIKKYLDA